MPKLLYIYSLLGKRVDARNNRHVPIAHSMDIFSTNVNFRIKLLSYLTRYERICVNVQKFNKKRKIVNREALPPLSLIRQFQR